MQLTCPDCGFQADVVGYLVEGEARQTLMLLTSPDLPARLPALLVRYLGLFKLSETRAVSWPRAHQLLRDLIPRLKEAPAVVWIKSVEQVLLNASRGQLQTPLRDHTYLMGVLVNVSREFTTQRASTAERKREDQLREGRREVDASMEALAEIGRRSAAITEHRDAIDSWNRMLGMFEKQGKGDSPEARAARDHIARHTQALEEAQS